MIPCYLKLNCYVSAVWGFSDKDIYPLYIRDIYGTTATSKTELSLTSVNSLKPLTNIKRTSSLDVESQIGLRINQILFFNRQSKQTYRNMASLHTHRKPSSCMHPKDVLSDNINKLEVAYIL